MIDKYALIVILIRYNASMLSLNRQITIFSKVVKLGSFKKAAEELQLSPSVISHHISDLEKKLNIALLYRTTRQLSLTPDGKRLLPWADDMQVAADGFIAAASKRHQLVGELNITVPAALAQSATISKIGQFSMANPMVTINLDFSDARRNLIRDNFDLAIRMGSLSDSTLKCRKIDETPRRVVVAPSYLQNKISPTKPKDIEEWDFIALSTVTSAPLFKNSFGEPFSFKSISRLYANNAYALLTLTRAGAGFAILPEFLVDEDIQKGSLVTILADWPIKELGIYATWPENTVKNNLTRHLVEFLMSEGNQRSLGEPHNT